MEAALLHSSTDQESMPSYKKARNPKRNNNNNNQQMQMRSFIPSRANSIANLYHTESLPKTEIMANGGVFSNPPFPLSSSLPRLNSSPYPLRFHQPPLLPLPASTSSRQFRSLRTSGGATRLAPSHKKHNKGNKNQKGTKSVSNNRLGPNPESLPKDLNMFSGTSVFPEAPPPISLPMPRFSLKHKMSCRVEASGSGGSVRVDTVGATGNLCRLLNLR